jgi:hypothetical protein
VAGQAIPTSALRAFAQVDWGMHPTADAPLPHPDFPRHGKKFSTLWKNPPVFSTPWKIFTPVFHAMENFQAIFPHRGKSGTFPRTPPPPAAPDR